VGVSPAGFGILPKQSFQVRDRETQSPAGETPTLPETKYRRSGPPSFVLKLASSLGGAA
jgi:hypothetical protein